MAHAPLALEQRQRQGQKHRPLANPHRPPMDGQPQRQTTPPRRQRPHPNRLTPKITHFMYRNHAINCVNLPFLPPSLAAPRRGALHAAGSSWPQNPAGPRILARSRPSRESFPICVHPGFVFFPAKPPTPSATRNNLTLGFAPPARDARLPAGLPPRLGPRRLRAGLRASRGPVAIPNHTPRPPRPTPAARWATAARWADSKNEKNKKIFRA